jgi:hypothetical protein
MRGEDWRASADPRLLADYLERQRRLRYMGPTWLELRPADVELDRPCRLLTAALFELRGMPNARHGRRLLDLAWRLAEGWDESLQRRADALIVTAGKPEEHWLLPMGTTKNNAAGCVEMGVRDAPVVQWQACCELIRAVFPLPAARPPLAFTASRQARAIAAEAYESRDWRLCSVLADCLEDDGVADAAVLTQLREGPWLRGMWSLDAVLGRP